MNDRKSNWGKGCAIAVVVMGLVVAICGGAVTLLGWSIWRNPRVQRVAEVEREARGAPGTAQLREAGCAQAKVYSPALLERFTGVFRGDGGVRDGDVPDFPVVVCVVHRGPTVDCEFRGDGGVRDGDVPDFPVVVCVVHREPTVDCETVARTYAEAVDPLPLRMGVTVRVGVDQAVRCEGLYGPDGTRLRSPDDDQGRIDDLAP